MFDIGQPIHTFDYDKLLKRAQEHGDDRPTISVRRARAGERMTTLDGVDRELNSDNLMICDAVARWVWAASWAGWKPRSTITRPAS